MMLVKCYCITILLTSPLVSKATCVIQKSGAYETCCSLTTWVIPIYKMYNQNLYELLRPKNFFIFFCSEAELYHSLVHNWQDFKYSLLRRSLWLRPVKEKENKCISAAPLWGLHLQRTLWFKKRESRLYCFYLINQIELFTHVSLRGKNIFLP